MVIAVGTVDGVRTLLLGLTEENVRRLNDDRPIVKRLDEIEGLDVAGLQAVSILGPEDTVRLCARVGLLPPP